MDPQNSQPNPTPIAPEPESQFSISKPLIEKQPEPQITQKTPLTGATPPEIIPVKQKKTLVFVAVVALVIIIVGITGAWAYQKYILKPIFTPSPSPTLVSNPTVNWKTYINDNYQIKYPEDWVVMMEKPNVQFGLNVATDNEHVKILRISTTHPYITNFSNIKSCSSTDQFPCLVSDYEITNSQLDGVPAKRAFLNYGHSIENNYMVLQTTNPTIEIKMSVSGGIYDIQFDQILSTFKFLGQKTSLSPSEKILLNIVNKPGGDLIPKKILFSYDRQTEDQVFLISDEIISGVQSGFEVNRNGTIITVTPEFEGFPLAHTQLQTMIGSNPNISTTPIYRITSQASTGTYFYVNGYSETTKCGDFKPNSIACSLSNIKTEENLALGIACKSDLKNTTSCDDIVKTMNFSWQ